MEVVSNVLYHIVAKKSTVFRRASVLNVIRERRRSVRGAMPQAQQKDADSADFQKEIVLFKSQGRASPTHIGRNIVSTADMCYNKIVA